MCVCSLMYETGNARASDCHLWPVQLYNIFPHYFINDTTFEKKKLIEHIMCVLIFSTTLL